MALALDFIEDIEILNPWLKNPESPIPEPENYFPRTQETFLMDSQWDELCLILIGPRRSGKTTLGNRLCQRLLESKRFNSLLYVNCDFASVRANLTSPRIVVELFKHLKLSRPIFFIDEVQRLENPGLFLKGLIDLKLDVKIIASGSSQLEIKSSIQEFLTGREIESLVLPLSSLEINLTISMEEQLIYGSYPQVVKVGNKEITLNQIYNRYIQKDIIEVLRLNRPDILEKLITLIAHGSGQLVNYQQLASDCNISAPTVQNYLSVLEKTYVLHKVRPFVGNKRTEITSNPKYYFIDNGFRNQALRNFNTLNLRGDLGLLAEGLVFQELIKYRTQNFLDFDIFFWRTKAQAEVDFVLFWNKERLIPIEVKYRAMKKPVISRGYRSFLEAYQPKVGVMFTKDLFDEVQVGSTKVYFIPLTHLSTFSMSNVIEKLDK